LSAFQDATIDVSVHDYRHPAYKQNYPGFQPYMTGADVLFNHGPQARHIITTGQRLAYQQREPLRKRGGAGFVR
jgi:WbqC-like protein family